MFPNNDSPPATTYGYDSPDLSLARSVAHTPSIPLYGDHPTLDVPDGQYHRPQMMQRALSDAPYWTPMVKEQRLSIPASPPVWITETDDFFQSHAQINQMFAFCKSCSSVTTNPTLCDGCTNVLYDRRALAPTWY